MKKFIVLWVALAVLFSTLLVTSFITKTNEYDEYDWQRFNKIKTLTFQEDWHNLSGTVYKDNETNIKYFYVYRGGELHIFQMLCVFGNKGN